MPNIKDIFTEENQYPFQATVPLAYRKSSCPEHADHSEEGLEKVHRRDALQSIDIIP